MKQQTTFKSFIAVITIVIISSSFTIAQERNRLAFLETGITTQGMQFSGGIKIWKSLSIKPVGIIWESEGGLLSTFKLYKSGSINIHFEDMNQKVSPYISLGIGQRTIGYEVPSAGNVGWGFSFFPSYDHKIVKSIQYPFMAGVKFDVKSYGKVALNFILDNAKDDAKAIGGISFSRYLDKKHFARK